MWCALIGNPLRDCKDRTESHPFTEPGIYSPLHTCSQDE